MEIHRDGCDHWTPNAGHAGQSHPFTVVVTDSCYPSLGVSRTGVVRVAPPAPTDAALADVEDWNEWTIDEGQPLNSAPGA